MDDNNKNLKICPPLGFGCVSKKIYRSSYPNKKTWSFIQTLGLKSMISLSPSDNRVDLRDFCKSQKITLFEYEVGYNQEPFLSMSPAAVKNVISILQDQNLPALIFCANGKIRTGCVVACLRLHEGWSLVSACAELEQYCEQEGGAADMLFIERYGDLNRNTVKKL